jgi:hypothetical protein
MSDWYGTSRSFANALRSSNIGSGNRIEMVVVVGFRLGNVATTEKILMDAPVVDLCLELLYRANRVLGRQQGESALPLILNPLRDFGYEALGVLPQQLFQMEIDDVTPALERLPLEFLKSWEGVTCTHILPGTRCVDDLPGHVAIGSWPTREQSAPHAHVRLAPRNSCR